MSQRHAGTVAAFDEAVGLGEVRRFDGERFMFHCIELSDGSRTIEVGVPVLFTLVRKYGRDEAFQVARA